MLVFHTKKFPSFIYFEKLTKKTFFSGFADLVFAASLGKVFFFNFPALGEKYGMKSIFVSLTLFYPGKLFRGNYVLKNAGN
jgi:hypothetical protein